MTELKPEDIVIIRCEDDIGEFSEIEIDKRFNDQEAEALKKQILEWQEFYETKGICGYCKKPWNECNVIKLEHKEWKELKEKADICEQINSYVRMLQDGDPENENPAKILQWMDDVFDGMQTAIPNIVQLEAKIRELENKIKEISTWYGLNQIHVSGEEAKKMIEILENDGKYKYTGRTQCSEENQSLKQQLQEKSEIVERLKEFVIIDLHRRKKELEELQSREHPKISGRVLQIMEDIDKLKEILKGKK